MDTENNDYDKWLAMWDNSRNTAEFKGAAQPEIKQASVDYFGGVRTDAVSQIRDVDVKYWQTMEKLVNENRPLSDLFTETKEQSVLKTEKPDGKSLGDIASDLANTPNPVSYPTRNIDQRSHVTPNWSCGVELVQLHNMKVSLEQLESKMNRADAFAKSSEAKTIQKDITELWSKLDNLSNKLTPDFIKEYMS